MPTGIWLVSDMALWTLVIFLSGVLWVTIRQVKEFHAHWVEDRPQDSLEIGSALPDLPASDLWRRPLSAQIPGRRALLFLSQGCGACIAAVEALPELGRIPDLELIVVVSSDDEETETFLTFRERNDFPSDLCVLADPDRVLFEEFRVTRTPLAFVTDATGRLSALGVVNSREGMERLLRRADAETRRREQIEAAAEPIPEANEFRDSRSPEAIGASG